MQKIKIITDSTSDLPKYIIDKYEIEVLPLLVSFGEESYKDGEEIKLHEFLEKMKNSDIFPTTSQVNPQKFYDSYKRWLDEGYKIISIHLSSKMSGTYQSGVIAKNMLESEDIVVIDTQNVTSGLGLLVVKACILKETGFSFKKIEEQILDAVPHVKSALAFESLENLVKGGRLSKTAGIMGNLLGIRPILAISDGEIAVMDKVRGNKKAIRTILDFIEEKGVKSNEPFMLLSVESEEILEGLRKGISSKAKEIIECEVGCVVGTHSGEGACGVFFIENY